MMRWLSPLEGVGRKLEKCTYCFESTHNLVALKEYRGNVPYYKCYPFCDDACVNAMHSLLSQPDLVSCAVGASRCPFDDCKSTDIVGTDGGVKTLAATMHNGRLFDGNETSLPFKCKDCGESFVVTYKIRVPDRIEVSEDLLSELFSDEATIIFPNQVDEDTKKNGGHLP